MNKNCPYLLDGLAHARAYHQFVTLTNVIPFHCAQIISIVNRVLLDRSGEQFTNKWQMQCCQCLLLCCYVAISQLTPIITFWGPVPLLAFSSFAWDRFFNRRNLMFWNLFSLILDPILKFNIWLLYAKKRPIIIIDSLLVPRLALFLGAVWFIADRRRKKVFKS